MLRQLSLCFRSFAVFLLTLHFSALNENLENYAYYAAF